jgi:hypothetical protein
MTMVSVINFRQNAQKHGTEMEVKVAIKFDHNSIKQVFIALED